MRLKVHASKKAKPRAISLLPHQEKFVCKRAFDAGVSVSRYFQLLAELDKSRNILADALTHKLEAA